MSIAEILENTGKEKYTKNKVEYLRKNRNEVLLMVLKGIYDPRLTFLLPDGPAPYKPNPLEDQEGVLYGEARRLYLFAAADGVPMSDISQKKREALFVQLLEMVSPKDAEMLVCMKDKKMFCKGVTRATIRETFGEDELYMGPKEDEDLKNAVETLKEDLGEVKG